jgi:hypothetical protein
LAFQQTQSKEIVVLIIVIIPKLMNKSYRFVESNSGKSNVTILSLFQALPTDLYSSNTLFCHTKKEYRNQNEKNAIFSFILVIIIGFLVIAGFFRLQRMGWYLLVFLLFAIILFSPVGLFPLLTLVFVCFFLF